MIAVSRSSGNLSYEPSQDLEFVDSDSSEDDLDGFDSSYKSESYRSEGRIVQSSYASSSSDSNETSYTESRKKEEKKRQRLIANAETKALRKLRCLLLMVLLVIAMIATIGVYFFSLNKDVTEFRSEYKRHANKVASSFREGFTQKVRALDSLSTVLTSYVLDHEEMEWPFVTVADSGPLLEKNLRLSNAISLTINPIVSPGQRAEWEQYSVKNQDWIDDNVVYRTSLTHSDRELEEISDPENLNQLLDAIRDGDVELTQNNKTNIPQYIHGIDDGSNVDEGPWAVWWQYAPVVPLRQVINFDRFSLEAVRQEKEILLEKKLTTLSEVTTYEDSPLEPFVQAILSTFEGAEYVSGEPISFIDYPLLDNFDRDGSSTVAILSAGIYWRFYFEDILPDDVNGVICVVRNTHGQVFSYRIDGSTTTFLGMEDAHDPKFDFLEVYADYHIDTGHQLDFSGVPVDTDFLSYSIQIYPSNDLEKTFITQTPVLFSISMLALFLLTALIFGAYDFVVARRQNVVMDNAAKTSAVVSELFPDAVRDRIMEEIENKDESPEERRKNIFGPGRGHSMGSNGSLPSSTTNGNVIADFYPRTSVLFCDIKGFTAWCSEREPAQVFILLESIFNCFDAVAKRRKVFKVETIGDCYMAVTGLPKPMDNHAVVMCKFAKECLSKIHGLLREMEIVLGPGTADLSMRFGIHSGAVTAGVIRSTNARYQLFGDTVNTASRMESNGSPGRVHFSEETANELMRHGKSNWVIPREDKIVAKGKGELQTYWLNLDVHDEDTQSSGGSSLGSNIKGHSQEVINAVKSHDKTARLVDWNVDVLSRLLRQILARRKQEGKVESKEGLVYDNAGATVLGEVSETIALSPVDPDFKETNSEGVHLTANTLDQLHSYVVTISSMYNDNAFHNFEHASHVAMSVVKLLSRIISSPSPSETDQPFNALKLALTTDPLVQFACVFSALIHDVDHWGVPNSQLVKERSTIASAYRNKSVAEQNSVDLAWDVLMQPMYGDLRKAIYCDHTEMIRFRQLVVNCVMGTDIVDPELKQLRNERWDRAFSEEETDTIPTRAINRKATIVIEHLLQASDVAHTMQHWHIYSKWNQKYFIECYEAYMAGRAARNPADGWYEGELGFFDYYIIPLAQKLKDCQVFGVSSDEYLNYATKNRQEWAEVGRQIVEDMVEKVQEM